MKTHSLVPAMSLVGLLWAANTFAHDDAKACADAAERAQMLKEKGHYTATRAELSTCLREGCPAFIRDDCRAWMEEVTHAQPMVVFSVHDERGGDLVDVRVRVDGATLREKLDGRSVEVDPGEHTFRFEAAGYTPVEQKTLIVQNVKNRVIEITMKQAVADKAAPVDEGGLSGSSAGKTYTLPIVFGAIGAVGIGMFTAFEINGQSQLSDIKSGCGSNASCTDDELSPARTSFRIAAASLGIGVVGLACAGVTLWMPSKRSSNVSVQSALGGASLRVRF